jgi:hypothetical protein
MLTNLFAYNRWKIPSAFSIVQDGYKLVEDGELDKGLRLIHDFVDRIITEPLCTAQVFGYKELDKLCQRIGKESLATIKHPKKDAKNSDVGQVFVYIVTKLQKSGGLRQVITNLIMAYPRAHHIIFSTELEGKSDLGNMITGPAIKADVSFRKAAPQLSYLQKLTWLQENLLKINPQKAYLLNHHQDSVAVAAIQDEMGIEASFYHHGDHHLCLGIYLPHIEHVDLHPMGYHYCRNVLGIKNTYVPLVVEDQGPRPVEWPFMAEGGLTTCTAARSNKVDIPYFVKYSEMIPRLLKTTNGRHLHIGRLHPWTLLKIRRGLKRFGITQDRLIYTPWVPSVWKSLLEYRIDLYIASFPYGGGLTLIEAMGAGVPVALHMHIFSRVLSGLDLAYPEAFAWRFPEELLSYCGSVNADMLRAAARLGRRQYEEFHRPDVLKRILLGDANVLPKQKNASDKFAVETMEWALWMEQQINIKNILYRTTYRWFRRFRAGLNLN